MDKENKKTPNSNIGSENKGSDKASQLATINESLARMTALVSTITSAGIEEVTNKEGEITGVMKEYQFFTPIGNRNTLKTFDAEIIASTERIAAALKGRQILSFVICKEMSRLNNKEKLSSMGFASIADYGLALFGFKKQTSNQYSRIGEIFINDNYQLESKILPSSLRVGHLTELLAYVGEGNDITAIEEAYKTRDLTDGMTTAKLRNALKSAFKAIESTATETGTETATETGTETATETGTETATETGTETATETGTETATEKNPLLKETAKLFNATIFIKDFVKTNFSSDKEFMDGIIEMLSVLEESTKALLVENPE